MDIEKIKAGFEEFRIGALEVLASANFEDDQERLKAALYCYIMFQHQYAQALLPEDQRLSDEESENMTRVASILSYNLENVMSDFQSLLDKGQANDYYIGFVYPTLMQFEVEQEEKSEDCGYIDLNNKNMRDYLAATLSLCLYVAYNHLKADDILSLIKNDTLAEFTHSATDPTVYYDWVKKEFHISVSDPSTFWELEENLSPETHNKMFEEAKETLTQIEGMMEQVMPLLCEIKLAGCKNEESLEEFKTRVMEMIKDDRYKEGLNSMFSIGMLLIALMPESFDANELLGTHEQCTDFFDNWYKAMAGEKIREFYEPLSDNDKNVARTCFFGGFFTAWLTSKTSEDGYGLLGLRLGAAYNLPKDAI